MPSETHRLRWADIDFDAGRMTVYAPKTSTTRVVPIVPRLMSILIECYELAQPGDDRVVPLSENNLYRTVKNRLR